jgi:transcriptional regulator with XRE-family HTH domain
MDTQRILQALKHASKAQGYTYARLAKKLQLSEAGVKRIMNAKDCSMNRVFEICKAIDVSLNEVLEASKLVDFEHQHFNETQVNLFKENPLLLKIYYKLRVEGLSSEETAAALRLSKRQKESALLKLEKLELLELTEDYQVVPFEKPGIYWHDLGEVFQEFKYDFTRDMIDHFRRKKSSNGFYPIYHLKVSQESRQELIQDFQNVIKKHIDRSRVEALSQSKIEFEPHNVSLLLAPMRGFEK